ncbi:MAG: hypothetical protein AAF634_09200 [Bacteroidota bacterium]
MGVNKTKILIISAGSMVSQNILETLKNRREHLYIVGTNASADAPLYDCDKIYLTPLSELPPSDYADELSKIIAQEAPDLVIPGRDIDIIVLALLKERFPDISDRFVVGVADLAQLMEDKWLSYAFAKKAGLPFAETMIYDWKNNKNDIISFAKKHGFPLIAKPRKGFASKAVSFIVNQDQLSKIPSDGNMIIQEYLGDGSKIIAFHKLINQNGLPLFYSLEELKYSMQMYVGKSGSLMGSIVTKHAMKNGVSVAVHIYENHGLDELIETYYNGFAKNGWYGPINVQLQRSNKTGELRAYEFNGRFTGATAGRYILGYDEVGFALEELSPQPVEKDQSYGSQKSVLKQTYISSRPECHMETLNKLKTWEPNYP